MSARTALIPSEATRRTAPAFHVLAAASLAVVAAACTSSQPQAAPSPQPAPAPQPSAQPQPSQPSQPAAAANAGIARARFDAEGRALIPTDWRRWIYVGTPLTPHGLNKGKAAFPEFHNVYVEPTAFDSYMKTGTWAQGTQIVKELVLVHSSNNLPDGSSVESSGRGYFQGEFHGLELLVKDADRFAAEPGGWAFFSFGHKPEPYDPAAKILPVSACSGCHEGGADTDFIFTQYYPMLRARAAKAATR